jgi:hypothetical protein
MAFTAQCVCKKFNVVREKLVKSWKYKSCAKCKSHVKVYCNDVLIIDYDEMIKQTKIMRKNKKLEKNRKKWEKTIAYNEQPDDVFTCINKFEPEQPDDVFMGMPALTTSINEFEPEKTPVLNDVFMGMPAPTTSINEFEPIVCDIDNDIGSKCEYWKNGVEQWMDWSF